MTTVYLIRHAEAEGNLYRRCQGWYNSLITINGYRQIEALEKRFREIRIDAVWSSDLFRTMTTAGAVYKPKGLSLHTDPGLREIGGGVWEDKPWGELYREKPEELSIFFQSDPDWQVEGSETYGGVMARMVKTLRRIAGGHDGETVAAFSHGAAIRAAVAGFDSGDARQIKTVPQGENTSVSKLVFDGDRVKIEYINDSSHLAQLPAREVPKGRGDGIMAFIGSNLWFRPLDFQREPELYRRARREAWAGVHHTLKGFQEDGFLAEAEEISHNDPNCVMVAMRGEERVGIVQTDPYRDSGSGIGRIPFLYMMPECRGLGLGVQLLGQAVSYYRPLDRQFLRLSCAPENEGARRFYERHGFYKVGTEPGVLGELDVLEKFIGYQLNETGES